jgi:hypothetical protein
VFCTLRYFNEHGVYNCFADTPERFRPIDGTKRHDNVARPTSTVRFPETRARVESGRSKSRKATAVDVVPCVLFRGCLQYFRVLSQKKKKRVVIFNELKCMNYKMNITLPNTLRRNEQQRMRTKRPRNNTVWVFNAETTICVNSTVFIGERKYCCRFGFFHTMHKWTTAYKVCGTRTDNDISSTINHRKYRWWWNKRIH